MLTNALGLKGLTKLTVESCGSSATASHIHHVLRMLSKNRQIAQHRDCSPNHSE